MIDDQRQGHQQNLETLLLNVIKQFLLDSKLDHALRRLNLAADLEQSLGIDSMGRVELFQRIDRAFGIHLPDQVLFNAITVADIAKAVATLKPDVEVITTSATVSDTNVNAAPFTVSAQPQRALPRGIARVVHMLINFGKLIYTLYIAALVFSTLPFAVLGMLLPYKQRGFVVKYWAKLLVLLSAIRLQVRDPDQVLTRTEPLVFVCNHSSYVDSLLLVSVLPAGVIFIAKQELLQVPILAYCIKRLHYVAVARHDVAADMAAEDHIINALRDTSSMIFYPEGTFTPAVGLRPFKSGAFKAAVAAGTAVCPLALHGTRHILRDETTLMRPGKVVLTVGTLITPLHNEWSEVVRLLNTAREFIAANCGEPTLEM